MILDKLLLPFLATLGASLTVVLLQFISRRVKETKQKIYAASYICDVSLRIITSEFILNRHTIQPHIEATRRISEGDEGLLRTTFLTNEFDILTAGRPNFGHLPNEFALQLGYDDIQLVQMYETLLYLHGNESNRLSLNAFVKQNLKSMESFLSKPPEKQQDILFTYYDYLHSLEHESNRIVLFIAATIAPAFRDYLSSFQFWLYRTSRVREIIQRIEHQIQENIDLMPDDDYMEKVRHGGIQGEL